MMKFPLALCIVVGSVLVVAASAKEPNPPKTLKALLTDSASADDSLDGEDSNDINSRYLYDSVFETKRSYTPRVRNNVIYFDLERDGSENKARIAPVSVDVDGQRPADQKAKSAAGAIAFNSREIRLVGPEQKEVEMKDDAATKMLVALENLQKEATDVWGQVNKKLDQGWTDLKAMVEDVLTPKKSGYSMVP